MMDTVDGPPSKRIRLDSSPSPPCTIQRLCAAPKVPDEDNCSICLHSVVDRTIIPTCSHEFCFECLLVWSEQSRKCPLCSQPVGDHVIHHIRSKYDYQKHYLPPLRTSPRSVQPRNRNIVRRVEREWGRRERQEREEADRLEHSISRRRWIYQHHLYAKHVASNSITRYRPCPTPAQFAASPDLISRMTMFLRRELRVWVNMDVEFLTTFILSLMKSIDIRSESAIKLLAEFLDMDTEYVEGQRHPNAEHFAHEVYSYLRSPYKDLFVYDTIAQYDVPDGVPPPLPEQDRRKFWRSPPRSRSRSPSRSRSRILRRRESRSPSRSRSLSWSPSGRQFDRCHREHRFAQDQDDGDRIRFRNGNREGKGRAESRERKKDIQLEQKQDVSRDRGDFHGLRSDDRKKGPDRGQLKTNGVKETDDKNPTSSNNDIKGKQKAKDIGEDKVGTASTGPTQTAPPNLRHKERSPTEDAVNSTHAPVSSGGNIGLSRADQTERKENRTLRNHSLQDSIRAHLTPHAQRQSLPKVEQKQAQQHPHVDATHQSTIPLVLSAPATDTSSLLDRLSDQTAVQTESSDHRLTPSDTNGVSPVPVVGDQTTCTPQIDTTHDLIMARTRARLATLKNAIKTDKIAVDTIEIEMDESRDVRARLLSRLEVEKKKHFSELVKAGGESAGSSLDATTVAPSMTRDRSPSGPTRSLLSRLSSTTIDVHEATQAAEADLRRRAQLRARLAAAKRSL